MDTKPGSVTAPIARVLEEWLHPSKQWGGVMTTWGGGARSFELHMECKLRLCRENLRRLQK